MKQWAASIALVLVLVLAGGVTGQSRPAMPLMSSYPYQEDNGEGECDDGTPWKMIVADNDQTKLEQFYGATFFFIPDGSPRASKPFAALLFYADDKLDELFADYDRNGYADLHISVAEAKEKFPTGHICELIDYAKKIR